MPSTEWLSPREERAWRGFQQMQMSLNAELARRLIAGSSLSYADYVVLVALTDDPDGRVRQFELARRLGWETSRLSHHLSRMAERGLVRSERCSEDRRGTYLAVTARGRREIEAAAPGHVDAVRELFIDHVTPEQLDAIADAAESVLAVLEEGEGEASSRS